MMLAQITGRTIAALIGAVASAVIAGTLIIGATRRYIRRIIGDKRVWEHLKGAPAENGLPAIPSLFAQFETLQITMNDVQATVNQMGARIVTVESRTKELLPNGGNSLADKIGNLNTKVDRHLSESAEVSTTLRQRIDEQADVINSLRQELGTRQRKPRQN
jgi:uncharacterized protein YoxC